MHILMVTNSFPPPVNSGRKKMMDIRAKTIINEGWNLSVVVIGEKDKEYKYYVNEKEVNVLEIKEINLKKEHNIVLRLLLQIYDLIKINNSINRVIKLKKIDILYTMNSPHTLHIHGILTKLRKKIMWLSEFRDPIANNPVLLEEGLYSKKIYSILEGLIMRLSDIILTYRGTPSDPEYYHKKYPDMKYKTIILPYAGINEVHEIKKYEKKDDFFLIIYGGMIYNGTLEEIKRVLVAFKKLKDNDIYLKFIGNKNNDKLNNIIREMGLENKVTAEGRYEIDEYLEKLSASDLLLHIIPLREGFKYSISLKTWDYINVKRPILALVPSDWELAKLINQYNLGYVTNPYKIEEIRESLINIKKDKQNNRINYNPPENIKELLSINKSETAFINAIKKAVIINRYSIIMNN